MFTRQRINVLGMLSLTMFVSVGCGYKQALIVTPNVPVPQETNIEKTAKIVRSAVVKRGWKIVEEGNGFTTAKIVRGQTAAEVKISYDTKNVDVRYVSSSPNLRYKKKNGEERIHNHYNTWVMNLKKDIEKEFIKQ